jgi:hypothetical protein
MRMIPKLTGNRCLCRACGEMFSTVGNFDRHRNNGKCRAPATVGLVLVAGTWKGAPTRDAEGLARRYGRTVKA